MLDFTTAWLIDVPVDRGQLAEAEAALEASGVGEEIPDSTLMNYLLWARGRLRLASAEADRGIADLQLFDVRPTRSRVARCRGGRGRLWPRPSPGRGIWRRLGA